MFSMEIKIKRWFFLIAFFQGVLSFSSEERIDLKPLEKYDDIPVKIDKKEPQLLNSQQREAKVFYFETIVLNNCTILPERRQKRLIEPYLRKKISLNDLNKLIKSIHQAYEVAGYVLEEVYFKRDSFKKSKSLDLWLIEPKISGLKISESKKRGRRMNGLLKVNANEVLKITDLQCAFDILNEQEITSYDFKLDTNPKRTWHVADITLKKNKKCVLGLGYDNYGSKSSGRDQVSVQMRLEDVLGMFEQWRFMHKTSEPFNEKKYSQTSLISLSIPYRRWRASFYGVFEKDKYPIRERPLSVDQILLGADLRYVLSKTWNSGSYVGGTLEHYAKQFYLNAHWISVQSGDVTKLVLWGSHYHYIFGGVVYGKLSYLQGIHASSAGMGGLFSKNFKKLNFDGFFQKKLNRRCIWTLSGNAQIGEPDLFNHEKFSLGGISTVRGFVDAQYKADSGYFIRNEVECLLFNQRKPRFFVGYDYGQLKPSKVDYVDEKSLQSICGGLRLNVKDISLEVLIARPIHAITSNHYTFWLGMKADF